MPAMTPAGRRLRKAAQAFAAARDRRDELIEAMRAEGASLRDIAEAAQMTHPSVLRILRARGVQVPKDECQDPPVRRPRVAEVRPFVAHLRDLVEQGAKPPEPYAQSFAVQGLAIWDAWLADPDHPNVVDLIWLREWQLRLAATYVEQLGYDPLPEERATAVDLINRMIAAAGGPI